MCGQVAVTHSVLAVAGSGVLTVIDSGERAPPPPPSYLVLLDQQQLELMTEAIVSHTALAVKSAHTLPRDQPGSALSHGPYMDLRVY